MKHLDYCSSLLYKKLGNISFQVWAHNDLSHESVLICGREDINTEPPAFLDLVFSRPTYKIRQVNNKIILFFLYNEGHQIAISIYQKQNPFCEEDIEKLFHLFYIFALEGVIEDRNKELHTIINSMLSVTDSLNLNVVLENIIKNALKVISASDTGYLLLFNEDKQRLITQVHVGFNDSIFKYQPTTGEGITGKVFEDGIGRIFNSKISIDQHMNSFKIFSPNIQHLKNALPHVESAMCVPIPIGDKRIGVMIIHQLKIKRKLTKHDLNILEGFAAQAGIAIQNATYYMKTTKQLDEITTLSSQLAEKNDLLQQRYDVHERFMSLSLKNKGINTFISEIGKMLHCSFLFFNRLDQRFYTPKIDDNKQVLSIYEIKQVLNQKYRPMYISITDNANKKDNYYIYPLHNGTLLLGCFILPAEKRLSKSDRLTLEQGATALTLELVRRTTNTKKFHQKTYEQFQRLISHDNPTRMIEYGKELGLTTNSHFAVIVLEIPHAFNNLQYIDFEIYQLTSQLEKEFEFTEKAIYSLYNEVVLLASFSDPEEIHTIYDKLLTLKLNRDRDNSPKLRGGMSKTYQGIEHLKVCYEEARNTVSYLAKHNRIDVIKYEGMGLNRLFINQPPEEIDKFVNEVFAPLRKENNRHTELEKTLETYIKLNRSAVNTAKHLHIHINTLYQRLKKIEKALHVDLNDSEDNMEIQLACHFKLHKSF